ncbi:hypothetical protein [Gemmatirosa kalamazoonensis]|nr:hypothetical protein [Gemmatirosa kalamazoonensis]
MRRIVRDVAGGSLVLGIAAAVAVAGAQPTVQASACEPGAFPLRADTLQAMVRALYPESAALTPGDSLATVALVFDADCRLTHHAMGRRRAFGMHVDTAFAQIMPGVRAAPWRVSGYTVLGPSAPRGAEIAWVILRADSVRR